MVVAIASGTLIASVTVYGQRGAGQKPGIAARADRPELHEIEGTVRSVKRERCARTTGRHEIGMHMVLTTDGGELNVHLGPVAELEEKAKRLPVGQSVTAKVFRTEALPEGHRIAQSVHFNGQTLQLRDPETLRPFWAGRGGGRGRGEGSTRRPRRAGHPRIAELQQRVDKLERQLQQTNQRVAKLEQTVATIREGR